MRVIVYTIVGIYTLIFFILLIGLLLPKDRTVTKQSILKATPEEVYAIVTNNEEWNYRINLHDVKMINYIDSMGTWEGISKRGNIIRFKAKEKTPCSFYSFEMESSYFTGYWENEFQEMEYGKTLFTLTKQVKFKNPITRTLSYLFFDLDKSAETYQLDLMEKLER